MSLEQAHNFKTTFRHRTLGSLLRANRARRPGTRLAPETIVLAVAPGVAPSGKPPVRMYVGTEPAQFRAERVLVWSIMQHRDPSRVYEIHLMKDLAGFNRRNWKTGFTCYRYAIPAFAGATGRAIYNDVDQIYLGDPAELFDMAMDGKGMLGINERENSVMLLDCEKMIRIWPLAAAQRGEKHTASRAAVHAAHLWSPLPGVWNARDGEYVAGQSKVLHFTTLQTQPWRPFPDDLRYEEHPLSDLWHGLERAADGAGFTVFTKARPSQRFQELRDLHRNVLAAAHPRSAATGPTARGASPRGHGEPVAALMAEHGARTLLDYDAAPIEDRYDGVVCRHVLEELADDDIPWTLDEVFGHARHFVYAVVGCDRARQIRANGGRVPVTLQSPYWWREQMAAAGRRNPSVKWVLNTV